ncbi:polyprenyl synthetase family protein [Methanohalophilus portucalensis]|uniref:Octaprenyl-diphosphate synthase n=2 Tax=Methanohalophilus portucalensis TaxID=39664 RepID=A0A1L9C4N0_9EURY|nr:polyprenyl synthetase family protein [Methanohalophilus portucalensis]ATU07776.1 polyprenyl synthetase [Methanohalophilus portucalensis]OJH49406.1 polyprenyl synthetase [Methanohalophilus portucalensis FDF-1]RNI11490.1 polyprenyl synthetase family protein [Methanohalophilus portucalensis FDF-1]SMH41126.1 octaprenyl-diphosphate synthase [Methanohalophilus portucalensis FDF-1]
MDIEKWDECRSINKALIDFVEEIDNGSNMKKVVAHICQSGGKKTRPVILLLSSRICGSEIGNALDAALSIELIHSASLIHDDLLDRGILRRGAKTAHEVYGTPAAMLAGDYLISKSIELISAYCKEVGMEFGRAGMEMAEGEAMDVDLLEKNSNNIVEYFNCIEKKTASLFAASAAMGAYIAGADEDTVSKFRLFGNKLGTAYQIVDDMLEYTSKVNNKESIHMSPSLVDIYRQDMTDAQAIEKTREIVEQLVSEAHEIIDHFPPSQSRNRLHEIANYATKDLFPEVGTRKC